MLSTKNYKNPYFHTMPEKCYSIGTLEEGANMAGQGKFLKKTMR